MAGRHDAPQFRILFVCTGNVCRSPFAEILTRHLLRAKFGENRAAAFPVASAGVHAATGSRMHPDTRRELTPWGLHGGPSESFVARQLDPSIVVEAELILTAQRHHRATVVELVPAVLSRTFTLREFARLLGTVELAPLPSEPAARALQLVQAAAARRGLLPPTSPEDDGLPDPVGKPQEIQHETAVLTTRALHVLLAALIPSLP